MTVSSEGLIREVTGEDSAEYLAIQSVTYNDNKAWAENPPVLGRRMFIFDRHQRTVGAYSGLEFDTIFGDRKLSTLGYNMVSILPEHRNGGNGRSLMEQSVKKHAAEGKAFAALYGFSEAFYRLFGFEVAGYVKKVKCDIGYLPHLQPQLPIQRLGPEDWPQLKECYLKFASRRAGLIDRTEFFWQRGLKEKTIFAFGDPIEAYLIVNLKTEFYASLEVTEIVSNSRRGYETALSYLKKLAINKSSVTWIEAADSPFLSQYVHTGGMTSIEIGSKPMLRGLSVPQLLRGISVPNGFQVTLGVTDPLIDENNGTFAVCERDGRTRVQAQPEAQVDANLTMGELTQCVAGVFNPAELGTVLREPLTEASHERLAQLFPYQSPTCISFY